MCKPTAGPEHDNCKPVKPETGQEHSDMRVAYRRMFSVSEAKHTSYNVKFQKSKIFCSKNRRFFSRPWSFLLEFERQEG